MLRINFAGREILDRPQDMARPYGLFVARNGLQGWKGLPAGRRQALARAVAHGEFDTKVFLPSRMVTVDGWVIGRSESDFEHATGLIAAAGGDGESARATVELNGSTRWGQARRILAEPAEASVRTSWYVAGTFQLQLVFADPRKYSEEQRYPKEGLATSIEVSHRGSFPAFPMIEVPSAPSSYTVSSPQGTFAVTGATAGGTHTVDLRQGRVYRNGVEMPGVGHGGLWSVPGGVTRTHVLSVPGRVRIVDTYI